MREIKFRAYDKNAKRFVLPMTIDKMLEGWGTSGMDLEWLQYTGFNTIDDEGVTADEVFEHDICKITSCLDEEWVGEVVWDETYLCWAVDIGAELYYFHEIIHCKHRVEKIGNIYENSELLKG